MLSVDEKSQIQALNRIERRGLAFNAEAWLAKHLNAYLIEELNNNPHTYPETADH